MNILLIAVGTIMLLWLWACLTMIVLCLIAANKHHADAADRLSGIQHALEAIADRLLDTKQTVVQNISDSDRPLTIADLNDLLKSRSM